jgi:hypothetical protein
MRPLNVLVGCESSGAVRREFRKLGHNAWSCDLKQAEDGDDHHIQCDILDGVLTLGWDMGIFFPNCKYLCSSGMHWTTRGMRDPWLTEDALAFVRKLMGSGIQRWALENPTGVISTRIRKYDQRIQPYEYGEDASKGTCLWLCNLPLLQPTKFIPGRKVEWPPGSGKIVQRWANQTDSGQNKLGPSDTRDTDRARTYPGIAAAMAYQWSDQQS